MSFSASGAPFDSLRSETILFGYAPARTGEWREWSDREIARRCRVGHKFVGKLREKMVVHTGEIASMDRVFIHHKTGEPTKMDTTGLTGSASV